MAGFVVGKPKLKGHWNPNERLAKNDPHVAGVRNNPQNEENFSKLFNKTGCEWG